MAKQKRLSNQKHVKVRRMLTWNGKCILCIGLSMIGTLFFFIIPYIRVLYYSLIDNQFRRNFVGLANFIETLRNKYFLLALKNSLLLIVICVPVLILLALVISLALAYGIRLLKKTRVAFILPMILPTASVVLVWRSIFQGNESVLPIYTLFIWKNIGICIVLLSAAFSSIDREVYEAASLDGTSSLQLHRYITVPLIAPTILFTVLLSIVNSFKVFKESYLYFGGKYPPESSYTLQYYMNNNFLKLDYQALATGAILTSILVFLIVLAGLALQRRFYK
ncbi:MAG: sugar ABC transporter permease [Clostridiales bacterium]|nr:sugar ABC transporter permease [Clostridiales bacterium]